MTDSMTLEMLKPVADLAPQQELTYSRNETSNSAFTSHHNGSARLRVADWLTDRGVNFHQKGSPTTDGRDVYLLSECPFDTEHGKRGEVAVMQERSGRTSFKCHHNSCSDRGWQDVKEALGKPARTHYDGLSEREPRITSESSASCRKPETTSATIEPGSVVRTIEGNREGTIIADNGATCVVEFVSDGWPSQSEIPKGELTNRDGQPLASTGFDLKLMDSVTFASTNFKRHYLVKRVLVEGQSCIVGGPKKALKTGTLVDLAVSLGTGTPFLSNPDFAVPERVRTCVLSGESGGFTLKETADRICEARNRLLSTADVLWGFELPQLANSKHLEDIERTIQQRGIRVLIIDPAYLCLLAGTSGINPGDVFAMGQILKPIGELGERTGCTIVVAHHTKKKDRKERYQPTDLEDLAMSGFAEWARQWLLLGRRSEYRGNGKHDLWLNVGGSAGHSGCYVLSVNEGVAGDDEDGRHWDTRVESARDAIERSREAAEQRKAEAEESRRLTKLEALATVIRKYPDGETKSGLRALTKPQPTAAELAELIDELIQRGAVEACDVKKNGATYSGFRPVPLPEEPTVGDDR